MKKTRASRMTKQEFELLKKQIRKIIQRNKIKTVKQIMDKLEFHRNIHIHQVRHALEAINAFKEEYYHIDEPTPKNYKTGLTKTCWRCQENKKMTEFKPRHEYFPSTHRLNICNGCIREEYLVTGTSINDLLSIYEYMEFRFQGELKPEYYERFWEKSTKQAV